MKSSDVFRTAAFMLLITASMASDNAAEYQKGTITPDAAVGHKSYDLVTGKLGYQINSCAEFQTGETVDFRVKENKIYIRRADGKEYKCSIEARMESASGDVTTPTGPRYQSGTIGGYEIRRDTHIGGGGGGGNGMPGSPVSTWTRHAKVYELHGVDLIYKVDYCGAFQAGQFSPGQEVQYRVDGDRVYILHDNNKEFSCQLEGTIKPADAKQAEPAAKPAPVPSASAKLSITSVPDGADIEVDGNFSGNTPSDLEIAQGERTIAVKKSGYKPWERKMKVVAGSNIHLNAEMEKEANP